MPPAALRRSCFAARSPAHVGLGANQAESRDYKRQRRHSDVIRRAARATRVGRASVFHALRSKTCPFRLGEGVALSRGETALLARSPHRSPSPSWDGFYSPVLFRQRSRGCP